MPVYDLCVVIPTLNERENVILLLERLRALLVGVRYEVMVVDDDSPDGTAAVVRRYSRTHENVHVLHRVGRRGLASACIEGMLATSASYIAVMDADLQHDETILPEMSRLIADQQLDVVVGSRNISGGSMGDFSPWRVKLSRVGKKLSRVERHEGLTDPMSGFFIVRRTFLDKIAHRLTGIGFKILLDIVLSAKDDVRIGEVPYHFRLRQHGQSKLDIIVGLEYMELILDKIMGDYVPVRFSLFCLVGAVGILFHLLIVWLLLGTTHLGFTEAQAAATLCVIALNYALNNSLTYRDRRRRGLQFWTGMLSFYIACSLGMVANLAISSQAFREGMPWVVAGVTGLMFSAVWNFGVTSMTIWRGARHSAALRAERRHLATVRLSEADLSSEAEL